MILLRDNLSLAFPHLLRSLAFLGLWPHFLLVRPATRASLIAKSVKNLPAVQETRVQPLGWEDPLEEGVATHSSILAWKIP